MSIDGEIRWALKWLARPMLAAAVIPVVSAMALDTDDCEHVWLIDKESTRVRLVCAKCGKVCYP